MPEPHDMRRGALLMGAISLAGYAVDYGFNLGLTRFLSPHAYGDYKVAFSFAFFCGMAVLLGGDRAAPMVLAPALERGETRRVFEYLRFYLTLGTGLGVLVIAATWTASALHVGAKDLEHHHALAWAVAVVPLNAAAAMVSRTLQSGHRPARAVVPWRLGLPILQLALFAGVILWRGRLTVHEAIVIGLVATAGLTLWQWLDVRRLGLVETRRDPEAREPREWLSSSLPMMGTFLVALALNQSDLYFLELLGDEGEVGHYAAASMAAHFVPLVQVTLVGLVAPMARPAIEKGAEASRAVFRQAQTLMVAGVLPVGVGLVLLGGPVLELFGPTYRDAAAVLSLLVLGNMTWALAAFSSLWLQYRQRAGVVLAVSIATLALDSLLNLVLIPRYGMNGAAASTAATLTLAATAIIVLHWRGRSDDATIDS